MCLNESFQIRGIFAYSEPIGIIRTPPNIDDAVRSWPKPEAAKPCAVQAYKFLIIFV